MTSTQVCEVCGDCQQAAAKKHHGGYSMTCYKCRERLLLNEPCKLMRKSHADKIGKWGEVPDWKQEPSCGCQVACKRRQYMRDGQTDTKLVNNAHK